MTEKTQSITRSLVELKTIDKRINKMVENTVFILCKTKTKNTGVLEEEYNKNTKSDYQSINDLISLRDRLKNAIVLSNAKTEVQIGNKKMTVAEAIEFKNTINYKQSLLERLKYQKQLVVIDNENHKQKLQTKIDDNVRIICGKDGKPDATMITSISEGIAKGDPINIYDPLNVDQVIKNLEREIEDFRDNVDFALSESNAVTQITV